MVPPPLTLHARRGPEVEIAGLSSRVQTLGLAIGVRRMSTQTSWLVAPWTLELPIVDTKRTCFAFARGLTVWGTHVMFVARRSIATKAAYIILAVQAVYRGKNLRFLLIMCFLLPSPCFRLRLSSPRINHANLHNYNLDDRTARTLFNFTIHQLHQLS